jgi:hypothetical protein
LGGTPGWLACALGGPSHRKAIKANIVTVANERMADSLLLEMQGFGR